MMFIVVFAATALLHERLQNIFRQQIGFHMLLIGLLQHVKHFFLQLHLVFEPEILLVQQLDRSSAVFEQVLVDVLVNFEKF